MLVVLLIDFPPRSLVAAPIPVGEPLYRVQPLPRQALNPWRPGPVAKLTTMPISNAPVAPFESVRPSSLVPAAAPARPIRLASLPDAPVPTPGDPPCFGLIARPKRGKVDVAWIAQPGVASYEIYRGHDTDPVLFRKVGQVGGHATVFVDDPPSNEATYLYYVRAFGASGACDSEAMGSHLKV